MTSTLGGVKAILASAIEDIKAIPAEDALENITGDLLDLKTVAELVAAVLKVCPAFPVLGVPC